MKEKVVILMGPTGVGKSEASINLAKKFNMEIISADSVQVFKEFDIGSAKITKEEMAGVPHYGIDLVSPSEEFSVSDYVDFTKQKIKEILAKGKTPLIVGGTGLYVKSLVEGYNFGGTAKSDAFREKMEAFASENGLEKLFKKLEEKAPKLAKNIDSKNKARVIRALEIAEFGSEKKKQSESDYDFKLIALNMPREFLYNRINLRSKKMLECGLVDEVKKLYEKYGDCQPMRAIGYKEVLQYLNGEISMEQLYELISQHTRNYAKRQLTFMRGMQGVEYYDVTDEKFLENIEENIEKWLNIR